MKVKELLIEVLENHMSESELSSILNDIAQVTKRNIEQKIVYTESVDQVLELKELHKKIHNLEYTHHKDCVLLGFKFQAPVQYLNSDVK
jgi:hypothetical protein